MSYMDIDKKEKFRSQSTDNLKRMNFDKGPIIKQIKHKPKTLLLYKEKTPCVETKYLIDKIDKEKEVIKKV